MKPQEQIHQILETYGGETADKAVKVLLEDPALSGFKPFMEFISKNWRDPFVPSLMHLSCKSVNGNPEQIEETAISFSLINLSLRILDDIIDKTWSRKFRTTYVGKFGEENSLVIGNIISAKAFTILNQANLDYNKKQKIIKLIWIYLAQMAEVEIKYFMSKNELTAKNKLDKIKNETINVQTCLKIGAIIGDGPMETNAALAQYGECLGTLLELQKDIQVSLNLTLELAGKIKVNALPYLMLKAKESSLDIENEIDRLRKNQITPDRIERLVDMLLNSKVIAPTKRTIRLLSANGVKSLATLEQNIEKEKLRNIIKAQEQTIISLLTEFRN